VTKCRAHETPSTEPRCWLQQLAGEVLTFVHLQAPRTCGVVILIDLDGEEHTCVCSSVERAVLLDLLEEYCARLRGQGRKVPLS
jgi:hypothetical protein